MTHKISLLAALAVLLAGIPGFAQLTSADSLFVRQNYVKLDRQIPMRDGVKLYTVIYVPKDAAADNRYPILMERTPYSAAPYGEANYPKTGPGLNKDLSRDKYIFVYQDVRGRYMSEGSFEEMTPNRPGSGLVKGRQSRGQAATTSLDESSDTYDTIEWLLKNLPANNGRVGLMGISYPGFYASAALPDPHPALKAVSPQAPVTDEFIGDDARHNGAFFLLDNFSFLNYFDKPRTGPTQDYENVFAYQPKDAYQFFLDLGPIKNANSAKYFNRQGKIWNEYLEHDTYDAYWQSRNIRPHLKNVKPATLVVGGWFDAEDLFGALRTYEAIEKQSTGNTNKLVMGPWTHGAWARPDWSEFGPFSFGHNTAKFYRDSIETAFFAYYLKDKGSFKAPEATVFDTGLNTWKTFDAWPPKTVQSQSLYFQPQGQLTRQPPVQTNSFEEYISDPAKPVPYTDGIQARRNNQYMIEDQRFAARRPDVVVFQTEPLTEDMVIAGPINARLFASTMGTDADFIVKIIDVLPDSTKNPSPNPKGLQMAGYQRLVRADVLRGKFRNSFTTPEPFTPGVVTEVKLQLPDVMHTFRKGHRLMVQVQHSWFPLVDRNPQKFINLADADTNDFQKATMRLYHDAAHPSVIEFSVLRN
ncbi:CocE/NonD family hydrolase [Spirosoma taeanense]|uniref:CocE/NonD family hydrolase n=1 Tax=Spirosoma taeanense TaxID=2735870 RepID=A0A6M5YDE7_9BACT|nr:CocE/NonD family hydrolase [Spirosoma taeanense]QJW91346.1 CocE/NonD family hydrolase [Spirosoma taeanense]